MKIAAITLLLLIMLTLVFALRSVSRGDAPRQTVKALTLRVALSLGLFLLLMAGGMLGWWLPHGR
ncbi:DUF2909 family protein [Vogesella indigofera]|uniref:DUF2909 family protein n=1 Tax=Vogesella indigofera TaxID=45465 RepID=UPI00234EBA12|nr:DUF2909 family protein [Vogesella indigofera]MDC7712086.1 DUF2909 family protein [Vogesella indigofera]